MKVFKNLTFDAERSFYGSEDVRIINCSFDGEADITTPVLSIKNPLAGCIRVPSVGQIIMDDKNAKGQIIQTEQHFGN